MEATVIGCADGPGDDAPVSMFAGSEHATGVLPLDALPRAGGGK
jgi:hypothetical protein